MSTPTTPVTSDVMTPAEVAQAFRVDPKTVTRWAVAGKLSSFRTPGGHRRFDAAEVRALLAGGPKPQPRHPHVVLVRHVLEDLGHTITIEQLGDDAAAFGAAPADAGRLAIVERTNGRFGTVRHVHPVAHEGLADAVARSHASGLGARYVDAWTGAAR